MNDEEQTYEELIPEVEDLVGDQTGVIEALSEEEAYLYAIMTDQSGLDLAEFCWFDPQQDDGCFRAWGFQWSWWRDDSPLSIDQCGRSVGKSLSIKVRGFAFPFNHPGQEMLLTAPELVLLEPIVNLIEMQLYATRLSREILMKGRGTVTHRPFMCNFANGARLLGRIPQRDGRGVKGCVAEGTLVLTEHGHRPVENVRIGDRILTHRGRWVPVEEITTDVAECLEVRGQGSHPITVSWDHRFLGAENLADHKHKRRFTNLGFRSVETLLEHQVYWATPTRFQPLPIPPLEYVGSARSIPMDEPSFWWLVGRYLADGYLVMNPSNGKERRVCWTVHPAYQDEMLDAAADVGRHMGQTARSHSSADNFSLSSAPLYRWLLEHFGQHAGGKRVPGFVLGMAEEYRRALLEGYLAGDGSKTDLRCRTIASSASQALVLGIQMLAQSLGFTVNCNGVLPPVTEIRGRKLVSPPQYSWRIQITTVGVAVAIADSLVGKVKRVTPAGQCRVFNLVTEDHSYVANSIMSHNTHPIKLEQDEAQNYPKDGWVELNETLKRGVKGAQWRAHGVSLGIQDTFHKYTQDSPTNPWKVHRFTAVHRPNWTDQERDEAIQKYGSREDSDFQRNIYGRHGAASNVLFNLHRLMRIVDIEQGSFYNTEEYYKVLIKDTDIQDTDISVIDLLDLPRTHLDKYDVFWIGQDVGHVRDPSEILVFAEYLPPKAELKLDDQFKRAKPPEGRTRVRLVARISLLRLSNPQQVKALTHIMQHYRPRVFAMDSTGAGLPLYQDMLGLIDAAGTPEEQATARWMAETVKGYNFKEKILVEIDDVVAVEGRQPWEPATPEQVAKEAGIEREVLEWSTDCLRKMVDEGRLFLPWDDSLIAEFQGVTFSYSKESRDQYGRPRRLYSEGGYHALDGCRMAIMGMVQHPLEEFMARNLEQAPVFDSFVDPY